MPPADRRLSAGGRLIDPFIVILLAWVILFAGVTGLVSRRRERTMPLWMVFGALLGPIALLLVWIAPPGRCLTCDAPVRGWLRTCEWCGNPVARRRRGGALAAGQAAAARKARASGKAPIKAGATPAAAGVSAATSATGPVKGAPAPKPAPLDEASSARIRERLTSMPARHPLDGTGEPQPVRGPALIGAPANRRLLGTAVYRTGTVALVSGSRYALELNGPSLRILGPTDIDQSVVAITQDLTGMEANGFEGRLVITFGGGGRHGVVLVFGDVEGATINTIAEAIVSAARAIQVAS
jgi:hypothetical protein